jgi:hypothetical protein
MPVKVIKDIKFLHHPYNGSLTVVQGIRQKNPEEVNGYVRDKKRPHIFWDKDSDRGREILASRPQPKFNFASKTPSSNKGTEEEPLSSEHITPQVEEDKEDEDLSSSE